MPPLLLAIENFLIGKWKTILAVIFGILLIFLVIRFGSVLVSKKGSLFSRDHSTILLIAGNNIDARSSIELYYPDKPEENKLLANVLPTARFGHVSGIVDDILVVTSGYNQNTRERFLKSTDFIDLSTYQVTTGPKLKFSRIFAGAAVGIYGLTVCGGIAEMKNLKNCEVLDSSMKSWVYFPSLNEERSAFPLLSFRGTLFAIGGFNGLLRLNSVEKFDQNSYSWQDILPMKTRRAGLSCAVSKMEIFCCGGILQPLKALDSCEIFDPINIRWREIEEKMSEPRTAFVLMYFHEKVYAFSGWNNVRGVLNSSEVFDLKTKKWSETRKLIVNRWSFTGVII